MANSETGKGPVSGRASECWLHLQTGRWEAYTPGYIPPYTQGGIYTRVYTALYTQGGIYTRVYTTPYTQKTFFMLSGASQDR